jgi:hypothetical protein
LIAAPSRSRTPFTRRRVLFNNSAALLFEMQLSAV